MFFWFFNRLLNRLLYIDLIAVAEHSYVADRETLTTDERVVPPVYLANGDKIEFKPHVMQRRRIARFAKHVDVRLTFAERVPTVEGDSEIRRANFVYECAYCTAKIGIGQEYAYVPDSHGYTIYCSIEHAKIGEGIGVKARA